MELIIFRGPDTIVDLFRALTKTEKVASGFPDKFRHLAMYGHQEGRNGRKTYFYQQASLDTMKYYCGFCQAMLKDNWPHLLEVTEGQRASSRYCYHYIRPEPGDSQAGMGILSSVVLLTAHDCAESTRATSRGPRQRRGPAAEGAGREAAEGPREQRGPAGSRTATLSVTTSLGTRRVRWRPTRPAPRATGNAALLSLPSLVV